MLCFIHIPKTAGTTFNFILRRSLTYSFMEIEPWVDRRRMVSPADIQLLKQWAPWTKHISSHYVRAYHGLEHACPDIRYATFLRDPVKRYLSSYIHFFYRNGRVSNFQEFLSNRSWANQQTKYICGSSDVAAAKQILMEKFAFIGLTEETDASLLMAQQIFPELKLDIRYGKPKNQARKLVAKKEVFDNWSKYESLVLKNNAADIDLYSYVCDKLFKSQKEKYGPTLEQDLSYFQSMNTYNVSNNWKSFASRTYYKHLLKRYRKYGNRRWPINNGALHEEIDFFGEYVF